MIDQQAEIRRLREALQAASMNFFLVALAAKQRGYTSFAETLEKYSKEAEDAANIPEQEIRI